MMSSIAGGRGVGLQCRGCNRCTRPPPLRAPRTPPLDPVAAAFLCQELIVDARLRHLARDRFEELQELSVLVFYFYNPEESQLELGGAAWAAMEAHMRDLSTALGFSSHVGVTTWSQRNFGTLYMVTSPAYQALL